MLGRRGLVKRRQQPGHDVPAQPRDVLARGANQYALPSSFAESDTEQTASKFMRGFRGWRRRRLEDEPWVKVDVTQVITQRCVKV
jgi:hypothetical protein